MSSIIAINKFPTEEWDVATQDLFCVYADLYIGFWDGDFTIEFEDLTFEYVLTSNGQTIKQRSYPPDGITYVSTTEPYVAVSRLDLEAETSYSLTLSATNAGKTCVETFNFTTPKCPDPIILPF